MTAFVHQKTVNNGTAILETCELRDVQAEVSTVHEYTVIVHGERMNMVLMVLDTVFLNKE